MFTKSPYKGIAKPSEQEQSPLGISNIVKLFSELNAMKANLQAKIKEADDFIKNAKAIQKGDPGPRGPVGPEGPEGQVKLLKEALKGDPGPAGKGVDPLEVAKIAAQYITRPKDGISPSEDKIVEKLYKLLPKPPSHREVVDAVFSELQTGDRKLSTKHIGDFTDGIEQTVAPIRRLMNGFRGGGDIVTAGSNITITTDSNGKKVITGSSGAGFVTLTATETPNGSIIVFTFAAAVAKPTYIIVDNVLMRSTSAAGTVNWTWSIINKQATFTTAPVDEILGVV